MKRIALFDWMRAVSAIFIIIYHYTTRYSELIGHIENYSINVPYGFMGVTVFFVLSGFLAVYRISNPKNGGGVTNYLVKRLRRLYPAYWVAMILTTFVCYFYLNDRCVSFPIFLVNFTMLQSFVFMPSIDGAYWTLSFELLFYLYVCVLLKFKIKERVNVICFGWIASTIIVNALRLYNFNNILLKIIGTFAMRQYCQTFIAGVVLGNMFLNDNKISNHYDFSDVFIC